MRRLLRPNYVVPSLMLTSILVGLIGLRLRSPTGGLTIEPSQSACGMVAPGAILERTFRITNNAGKAVSLERVLPTCGCTSAVPGRSRLNAGEATTLTCTVDLGTRRQSFAIGVTVVYRPDGSQVPSSSVCTITGRINNLIQL